MATTPNYGWVTPDNTSFVKDGAAAIRTVSNSIDATVFNATGGNGVGLQMLVNRDFAAAASESFTNVFSATYSRYRVLISAFAAVGAPTLSMQFRENVTNVGTLYNGGSWQIRFDAATAGVGFNAQNFIGAIPQMGASAATRSVVSLDIYRSATDGIVTGTGFNGNASGTYQVGANRSAMTNFTGFTISPSSSTMTGNVKIYGYKEVI